jgi:hypothetical protein
MGIKNDSAAGRREFERLTEQRRLESNLEEEWAAIRRGWFLGDPEFKKELLEGMDGGFGEYQSGVERFETDEAKAELLVSSELRRRNWSEADLERRRKGDKGKVEIAERLRKETTMTLKWIATRLQMGAWTHVANCLARKHPS